VLELLDLAGSEVTQRRAHVRPNWDATACGDALARRLPREPLEPGPEGSEARCSVLARRAHDRRDLAGEGRSERGDGTGRAGSHPAVDERLGADEDREAVEQVRRERLPRRVGDLQAGEVRLAVAKPSEHVQRDGVAARACELVDVEGRGRACLCRGAEVRQLRRLVEGVIRWRDHSHGVYSRLGRMRRKCGRVGRCLRPTVRSHEQATGCRLEEALEAPLSFGDREQDSLTVRPEREQAVEAGRGEIVDEGSEGILVESRAAIAKWRHARCNRTPEHGVNLCSAAMTALRVERDGDVLRVTLARPDVRNAFDAALIAELAEAFVDVGKVRGVVLAGEGPSFCAGADIEWMRASVDLDYENNVTDANALRRMLEAIDSCPAPVVAVVQGHALGGGVGLVACSDIVLAHQHTVFAFSEVKLGIIPAVISPFALAKIGPSAARRYFLTGERFDAATARRIGLVHEVTDDLGSALSRVLAELHSAGPRAVRAAKRLVLDRPDGPETARRIAERRTSPEGQEGLRAFLECRSPGEPGFASWSPTLEEP
jgi:methylglutaconyl-CoA hydratase